MMNLDYKKYSAPALILLLVLVAFGAGWMLSRTGVKEAERELSDFKQKVSELMPPPEEIRSLSGTVTKIEGNVLTVESYAGFIDDIKARQVVVTSATELLVETPMDEKAYRAKYADYFEKMESAAEGEIVTLPPQFSRDPVALDQIRVGDAVNVEANESFLDKRVFEASRIVLHGEVVAVPSASPAPAN